MPGPADAGLFRGLIDDAALFPPGNAPMPCALADHAAHSAAWYADLVGPFVCTDRRIGELRDALRAGRQVLPSPFRVALILTGAAGAPARAVEDVVGDSALALGGVEVAVGEDATERAARRLVAAAAGSVPSDVPTYVEVPRGEAQLPVLDALVGSRCRAKLRTGGTDAAAFPSAEEIARFLRGCVDRGIRFKCTAGLHHAVRHTWSYTGFEHHGFLNVLLAVHHAVRGEGPDVMVDVLEDREPAAVAEQVRGLDGTDVAEVRQWFDSYGSCSVSEPVEDLVALGLLTPRGASSACGGHPSTTSRAPARRSSPGGSPS